MVSQSAKFQTFSRLSGVTPEDRGTWAPLFLTLDFDWAEDEIINDTIDLVEKADVEATWFVTHNTSTIDRLRRNPKFDVGIHPNFNHLLAGNSQNGRDIKEVISRLLEVVPDAKCLRSHSLCTSTRLLQLMPEFGLTHESNLYLPPESLMPGKPFRIWNGVIRIPHSFEDDMFLLTPPAKEGAFNDYVKSFVNAEGIRVLDFHPIHAFLNTEDLARYERTRAIHRKPGELIGHRHAGEGTRTALETLLEIA